MMILFLAMIATVSSKAGGIDWVSNFYSGGLYSVKLESEIKKIELEGIREMDRLRLKFTNVSISYDNLFLDDQLKIAQTGLASTHVLIEKNNELIGRAKRYQSQLLFRVSRSQTNLNILRLVKSQSLFLDQANSGLSAEEVFAKTCQSQRNKGCEILKKMSNAALTKPVNLNFYTDTDISMAIKGNASILFSLERAANSLETQRQIYEAKIKEIKSQKDALI